MAFFNEAFPKMIKNEGGYKLVNDPKDRGGETYAGISRRANPDWLGWQYPKQLIKGGTPTIRNLVKEFYREEYWGKIRGLEIGSQEVAEAILSMAVLSGVDTASRAVQRTISTARYPVDIDGIIGSLTSKALSRATNTPIKTELFLAKYALLRIKRHIGIAQRKRSQRRFVLGWVARDLRLARSAVPK